MDSIHNRAKNCMLQSKEILGWFIEHMRDCKLFVIFFLLKFLKKARVPFCFFLF